MTKRSFILGNVVAIAICLAGTTMFSGCDGDSGNRPSDSNKRKELTTLKNAAEKGNAVDQIKLGDMYREGWFTKNGHFTDWNKAFEWYEKAANQGNVEAQVNLARMYGWAWAGQNVSTSDEKAIEWFQKAADQGYADGQYELGRKMYSSDKGVCENNDKAIAWIQKAANQGHKEAIQFLKNLPKDTEAMFLFDTDAKTVKIVNRKTHEEIKYNKLFWDGKEVFYVGYEEEKSQDSFGRTAYNPGIYLAFSKEAIPRREERMIMGQKAMVTIKENGVTIYQRGGITRNYTLENSVLKLWQE
ncbi:MAG: sel1 repeat family protein [Candidatus Azobacteroides sp.]|nr:sel1 repeat family protein [Candidatus Azobacteroides sp.]